MNFTELRTELFARGTDYLNEDAQGVARADRWLNQAYNEILNSQAWSFLEAETAASAPPVYIPLLKRVRYVYQPSTDYVLYPVKKEELISGDRADLTTTGTAEWYYVDQGFTVKVFPVDTTPIVVGYIQRSASLSGTQTPVFDEAYHGLIVDKAMIRAYIDSDNFEAAAALKAEVNEGMAAMAEDYAANTMGPYFIRPSWD